MAFRLFGIPPGPATVELTRGAQTTSHSITVAANDVQEATAEDHYALLPGSTVWNGISATIAKYSGLFGNISPPKRPLYWGHVEQVDGLKLSMDSNDNTYTGEWFTGATVDVYRVVGDDLTYVGSREVAAVNLGTKHYIGAQSGTDFAYTQAGGFSFNFASFTPAGVERWLGVAALDSGGLIGPVGWASYTPANTTSVGATNANTVAMASYTDGGLLAAPANVTVTPDVGGDGTVHLTWDAVVDAVAYVPFVAWSDPSGHPVFPHVELVADGGVAVQAGDIIVVRGEILQPTKTMVSTRARDAASTYLGLFPGADIHRNWWQDTPGFEMAPLAGAVQGAGDWQAVFVTPGTGRLLIDYAWNRDSLQSFYHTPVTGETYRVEFWIRADRAATLSLDSGLPGVSARNVNVTTDWQHIVEDFIALPETGEVRGIGFVTLNWAGDGTENTFRVAGFRLFMPSQANPANADFAALAAGVCLRDHTLIKTAPFGYTIDDIAAPLGFGFNGRGIHALLSLCAGAGSVPWLQIEPFLSPSEWEDLVAYLGAPVSSGHPMALRRQANGRAVPWTDAFDSIVLEFGNEPWNYSPQFVNPPSGPGLAPSEVYGLTCRLAVQTMQASPHWSSKINFVLGGHSATNFGEQALTKFRLPCEVGIATYLGGWESTGVDTFTEDATGYQKLLGWNMREIADRVAARISGIQAACTTAGLVYGNDVRLTCYEAGPGYVMDGANANGITEEVMMKSRAAAAATLDLAMTQAALGFSRFNYFSLLEGQYWAAAQQEAIGGSVYLSWRIMQILHQTLGTCHAVAAVPLAGGDVDAPDKEGVIDAIQTVSVTALQSTQYPGRKALVIVNRSQADTVLPVVRTTWESAAYCTVYASASDHRQHNRWAPGQRLAVGGSSYEDDPLSVDLRLNARAVEAPSNLGRIVVDDSLGATESGIPPGGFVIAVFDDEAPENAAPFAMLNVNLTDQTVTAWLADISGVPAPAISLTTFTTGGVDVSGSVTGSGTMDSPWSYTVPVAITDTPIVVAANLTNGISPAWNGSNATMSVPGAQGVAPSATLVVGLTGRTVTAYLDGITGAPSPTESLDTFTVGGVDVSGSVTGTGFAGDPWTYVHPDAETADAVVITASLANTVSPDWSDSDSSLTVPAVDVTPPTASSLAYSDPDVTLTMSEAGTLYIRVDSEAAGFWDAPATFKSAVQADATGWNLVETGLTTGANSIDISAIDLAAGDYTLHVLAEDTAGNLAVAVQSLEITLITVPAQMSAPTVTGTASDTISVDRAAAPTTGGSAITSYDLRWSTDQATWTTVTGIADPQTVGSLTASTTYYVQTRAVNAVGAGAWSASGSGATTAVSAALDATLLFRNTDFSTTNKTSFDTGVALGGKKLAIVLALRSGSGPAISVDGNAATVIASVVGVESAYLAYVDVPEGVTSSIISTSENASRQEFAVYELSQAINTTPINVASSWPGDNTLSGSVSTVVDGLAFVVGRCTTAGVDITAGDFSENGTGSEFGNSGYAQTDGTNAAFTVAYPQNFNRTLLVASVEPA